MKKLILALCIFALLCLAESVSASAAGTGGENPIYLPLIEGPLAAPVLAPPQNLHNGFYTLSWTAMPDATAYTLEEIRGTETMTVYTGPLTSWTAFDTVYPGLPIDYRVNATVNGAPTAWSNTQSFRLDYGFSGSGVLDNSSTFKDPTPGSNIRYVVGEVFTDTPSHPVSVTVTFFNGTTPVGTANNFAYRLYTDPNSMAPFKIVADDPGAFTSYSLSYSANQWAIPAPRWTILSQNQSVGSDGLLTVSGQVRNDSVFNIVSSNSIVVGTAYDANGTIINVDYVDLVPSSVNWHDVRSYAITFLYPPASSIAHVRIHAFGDPPPPPGGIAPQK